MPSPLVCVGMATARTPSVNTGVHVVAARCEGGARAYAPVVATDLFVDVLPCVGLASGVAPSGVIAVANVSVIGLPSVGMAGANAPSVLATGGTVWPADYCACSGSANTPGVQTEDQDQVSPAAAYGAAASLAPTVLILDEVRVYSSVVEDVASALAGDVYIFDPIQATQAVGGAASLAPAMMITDRVIAYPSQAIGTASAKAPQVRADSGDPPPMLAEELRLWAPITPIPEHDAVIATEAEYAAPIMETITHNTTLWEGGMIEVGAPPPPPPKPPKPSDDPIPEEPAFGE